MPNSGQIVKGRLSLKNKTTRGETLTQSVKAYLEAHYAEKFSLETMSGALFVSGGHLMRTFRKYAGTTPLEYHHRIRCQKARELLMDTDQSISEIGEAVGFESSSHFAYIFKQVEGCTATEYRKNHNPICKNGPDGNPQPQACSELIEPHPIS